MGTNSGSATKEQYLNVRLTSAAKLFGSGSVARLHSEVVLAGRAVRSATAATSCGCRGIERYRRISSVSVVLQRVATRFTVMQRDPSNPIDGNGRGRVYRIHLYLVRVAYIVGLQVDSMNKGFLVHCHLTCCPAILLNLTK